MEFGEGRARPGLQQQPPRVGEHNRAILAGAGMAEEEIEALVRAGVLVAAMPAEASPTG